MPPTRRPIRLAAAVYSQPGRVFSVTIGVRDRAPVFADLTFGCACVDALREVHRDGAAAIYAYCLMPDHVHLIVGVGSDSPLAGVVGAWKSHCYHVRRQRGDPAPFWQRSYFDRALRRETDLQAAVRYVLENPVRAGLVRRAEDYPLGGSFVFDVRDPDEGPV